MFYPSIDEVGEMVARLRSGKVAGVYYNWSKLFSVGVAVSI